MARHVIKLGSGIVARDDGTLRSDALAAVADEVAARRRAGDDVVVVSSGAIARGLQTMGIAGRPTAIEDLQAASAVGQGRLFRFYDELLAAREVTAAQVLLTFFDLSHRTHYLNARQTLRRLLDWGVVPVINENDTTATDEISFGDNDFLAAQVAILVEADRLVLLTGVDGVYTADPRTDPDASKLDSVTFEEALRRGLKVVDAAAFALCQENKLPMLVFGAEGEDTISRAVAGEKIGTLFTPSQPTPIVG